MEAPIVKGGCGRSAREVENSSLTVAGCFILALIIIGGVL